MERSDSKRSAAGGGCRRTAQDGFADRASLIEGPPHGLPCGEIVRSKRRTIALVIDKDGRLVVRAPRRASEAAIRAFLLEKEGWIRAHTEQVRARRALHPPLQVREGELAPYLGREYPMARGGKRVALVDGMLWVPEGDGRRLLEGWYRAQAREVLRARVDEWAARMGPEHVPADVRITGARGCWGSCTAKNRVCFSWRAVLCTGEAIDYLVVHELSHLPHRNHGRAFWQCVERWIPGWRAQRDWLHEHQALLETL